MFLLPPLLALALLPVDAGCGIVRDRADLIEQNHCFNENAVYQYSQFIIWGWDEEQSAYHVRWWLLDKSSRRFERDGQGGASVMWSEVSQNLIRSVSSPAYRETWTCYDPEALDREELPESRRIGMSGVRGKRVKLGGKP